MAVAAFYKAMHLAEAVLFRTYHAKHTFGHDDRHRVLKSNRRYEHIYKHYRPLWEASLVARYLEVHNDGYPKFTDYMATPVIQAKLINHYLNQVEQGVTRLLGSWPVNVPRCVAQPPNSPPAAATTGS
ncbi:hypothetical protein GobsT_31010 [Gemmata obscuriglobus]|nr:hypothetical protein GobsT_31010 [Gemmata obscuriglobus]VTS06185.1 unnamed protein product [Gemmata obscuriglobus UQM 2246]